MLASIEGQNIIACAIVLNSNPTRLTQYSKRSKSTTLCIQQKTVCLHALARAVQPFTHFEYLQQIYPTNR